MSGTDPMPVFTIKAKDKLAIAAIDHYGHLCRLSGLAGQAAEVDKALNEMFEWRDRHPDLIQLPDHPHVPSSQPSK